MSDFKEELHPRDGDGKFTEKAGGKSAKQTKKKAKSKAPTKSQIRREEIKYRRVERLKPKTEYLNQRYERDLRRRDSVTADSAAIMGMILQLGLRPGYTGDTFGAATLTTQHVTQESDGSLTLRFKGKRNVDQEHRLPSGPLADYVYKRAVDASYKPGKMGGVPLFEVKPSQLSSYAKKTMGGTRFKIKDLRTLKGTEVAETLIKKMVRPTTARALKKKVQEVAKVVAKALGNTPAVALRSYIDPRVFEQWKIA